MIVCSQWRSNDATKIFDVHEWHMPIYLALSVKSAELLSFKSLKDSQLWTISAISDIPNYMKSIRAEFQRKVMKDINRLILPNRVFPNYRTIAYIEIL